MIQKMADYMEKENMLEQIDHVIVGCSGGADSVALLLMLREYQKVHAFHLSVVHVEHGIRGEESLSDQNFVSLLCEKLAIPMEVVAVNAPSFSKISHIGLEEAARILRYQAFEKVAMAKKGNIALAVAHHMEDNAETVLFSLARGSGIAGLCGMSAAVEREGYRLIRPLLCFSREELEQYLEKNNQIFCMDSTNFDDSYSRNRIRRQILPQLTQINAKAIAHVNQSAEQLKAIWEYMFLQAQDTFDSVCQRKADALYIDIEKLASYPEAIQTEVIRMAIFEATGQKKDITSVHVESVRTLFTKQSGRTLHLPYGLTVTREQNTLRFCTKEEEKEVVPVFVTREELELIRASKQKMKISLGRDGEWLDITIMPCMHNAEEIVKKTYTKILDYDKIKDGFVIRNRMQKDYFEINQQGNKKKLSNYLIDEKIPASQRDKRLLLVQGNTVVWFIGGRISETYKITEKTKQVIMIEYHGGEANGLQCKA